MGTTEVHGKDVLRRSKGHRLAAFILRKHFLGKVEDSR